MGRTGTAMYDYIVIGSGIAGLFTALLASKRGTVLLLTKSALEESNTRYAQGGIAAAIAPDDSPRLHYEDTMAAGAGLCDERAADVLTREAPARIQDLLRLDVPFDRHEGALALGLEGAHRVRRVLHAGGDATGAHIEQSLCRAIRVAGVTIVEGCFVTEIVVQGGRAAGVRTIDAQIHRGRIVVLASGGAGQLFAHTTNPEVATGDGLALAYRAGAELTDLEFYQFHPTALAVPGFPTFLISEAVRGEGAYLRNAAGERFMLGVDARGELAPRDVVARAIVAEMHLADTPHVFLDLRHLPEAVRDHFPTIDAYCEKAGLDMMADPLPVAPAAHYLMGGVRSTLWGETTVPGLYACGEVAATGVHGANRLASNSLLEGLVFAARIIEHTTSGTLREDPVTEPGPIRVEPELVGENMDRATPPTRPALQRLMWDHVGLIRDEIGLRAAGATLAAWHGALPEPNDATEHELANMVLIGRLMAAAALARQESRGAHFRSDFPDTTLEWRRHIVVSGARQEENT
jgi:L-aspartate oxidase